MTGELEMQMLDNHFLIVTESRLIRGYAITRSESCCRQLLHCQQNPKNREFTRGQMVSKAADLYYIKFLALVDLSTDETFHHVQTVPIWGQFIRASRLISGKQKPLLREA